MKLYSLLLTLLLMLVSAGIFADEIGRSSAEKVAVNFYFEKSNLFDKQLSINEISIIETSLIAGAYYVVNLETGWVIVAANDAITPVIGYGFTGHFPSDDQLNDNLKSWIYNFVDQVTFVRESDISASQSVSKEWVKYLSNEPVALHKNGDRSQVDPLLTSKWNQDSPYNVLCPVDEDGPGNHVYVGCVATAMIQIMNYWRYPNQGTGSFSYNKYPYGILSVDFADATYDWDAMQDNIDINSPWEIAEIGYHAAVSVKMDFSPTGSGAYSQDVPKALENYFNYSTAAQYVEKSDYSFADWENMIQAELDNGYPMYYSGYSSEGGHAFVLDGYQGSNYYHFNFGWGGTGNGYYTLQDVNNFNSGQGLVMNIIPADPDYPYIASGNHTINQFSGSFSDGSGPVENYPGGMNTSWLIDPQTEIDSVTSIKLSFVEFNTGSNDFVKVYAGATTNDELIGAYSGDNLPNDISIDGNQMLVTFNSTGTGEGFKMEFNTTQATWCNGSQTYSDSYGTFSDGSGDFYYTNQSTCVYLIQNSEADFITLKFTEFATEQDNDFIQIYNQAQQLVHEFSGQGIPETFAVEGSTIIVVWHTNATIRDKGWKVNYYINGVGITETSIENLAIYPNPASGELNIVFDAEKINTLELRLVNLNGQTVFKEIQTGFSGRYSNRLDISDFPKGIYLLSIISEKGKTDTKVVLQ